MKNKYTLNRHELISLDNEDLKDVILDGWFTKPTRAEALEILIGKVRYAQASESAVGPKNGW